MTLKAVFLDVGNTLVRESPSRFEIYAGAASSRGVDVSSKAMLSLMREAHAELPLRIDGAYRYSDPWFAAYIRRIFIDKLALPAREANAIQKELFAAFEDPATFHLYPGAIELFEGIRGLGLGLGIISNWSARLPRVLSGLGIEGCFDFVLCSAIEEMEKPQPEIFREALERAGVAPRNALHAGDHPEKDVAAAESVGIEGVLVDHVRRYEDEPTGTSFRAIGLPDLMVYISRKSR